MNKAEEARELIKTGQLWMKTLFGEKPRMVETVEIMSPFMSVATPMEQIQDSWRRRWTDPAIERPSCYNRADYPPVWLPGCPHWRSMGNAHVTPRMVDRGGKRLRWVACNGCGQKEKVTP